MEHPSEKLHQDMEALPRLLKERSRRRMRFYTSQDSAVEIQRLRRTPIRELLMSKKDSFPRLPVRHELGQGKAPTDRLAHELEAFLLEKTRIIDPQKREAVRWDACHLAVYHDNACDVFLTTDYASLWAYRRALKSRFGIVVKRPVELLEEIQ